MKYYVIINGNSSLNIQGLAIESLPNISKPLIRTTREEIDGRDGDIITKLGYSAYDKTLNIGLWGNYDINEVIAFFNQEGVITFSNEPDKYYKFTIVNRIDFVNELEKFKKASITIHCQPFKYQEQPEIVAEEEAVELTGTSFTISDSLEAPILMDLKGNTSQTGTPTPSSPIPVNVVSGDNQIVVSDGASATTTYNIDLPVENLIDYDNMKATGGYGNEGYLPSNTNYTTIQYIKVQPNTKYTLTTNIDITKYSGLRVSDLNSSKTFIRRNATIDITSQTQTFTTSSDAVYIALSFWTSGTASMSDITQAQLEQGSKPNTYTPYGITPIELCEIETYPDYFYREDDKWYLHKEVGKVVLDGSETGWGQSTISGNLYFRLVNSSYNHFRDKNCYSNNYKLMSARELSSGIDYGIRVGGAEFIQIRNKDISSIADFQTWLSTHNTSVYYVLATPTNTEITYQPLLNQLNAIGDAESYEGTTNINQVNNDLPFILGLTYFTGDNTITITNDGNIYSKPLLRIKGTSDISISLNGIQIFQITLQNNETIIIDTEKMEAYYDGILKNRQVIGDYNNFKLNPGENTIEFNGAFDYVRISRYSRWV